MDNISSLLNLEEPLSKNVVDSLISYDEEDDRLDYKTTLDISSNKEWLELTKDISAFANTHGGYLVFGVSGTNNEVIGITREVANTLKDSNNIQKKVNRNIEPGVASLRSKEFRIENKIIVVVYIPQSKGITHVISKDGAYTYPSGDKKTILKKGTFYIRRSAGNQLADSRDLDNVIDRRIDQFREALINKVAMVVNSPAESNVYILSKDPSVKADERFIIENSSDSIPVKGMSFTIAPDGNEEEISAWSVLYRDNSDLRPPPIEVWKWYSRRTKIQLSKQHRLTLFKFSLWDNVPAFYWIQGLKIKDIKTSLFEAIRDRPSNNEAKQMLTVSAFLGETNYKNALNALGSYKERLAPAMKTFPSMGPRKAFGDIPNIGKQTLAQLRSEQAKLLNEYAEETISTNKIPTITKRWKSLEIDCFLYAQDDGYK
ncbi:MAG: ATP-binding protein [Woeseiaceae bacterium]